MQQTSTGLLSAWIREIKEASSFCLDAAEHAYICQMAIGRLSDVRYDSSWPKGVQGTPLERLGHARANGIYFLLNPARCIRCIGNIRLTEDAEMRSHVVTMRY